MNFLIRVPLNTSPEQHARLCELRAVFARVCNELAPQVQKSKVWNRVRPVLIPQQAPRLPMWVKSCSSCAIS